MYKKANEKTVRAFVGAWSCRRGGGGGGDGRLKE